MESRAIEVLQAQKNLRLEGIARKYLATIEQRAGDLDGAEREVRRSTEILAAVPSLRCDALATLADVLLARGRVDEAREAATQAMAALEAAGKTAVGEAAVRLAYAEAAHAAGDVDGARAAIATAKERLLARAKTLGDPELREAFLSDVAENVRTFARAKEWTPQSS